MPALAGVEFFKAVFITHAYARHTHDDYAIGATSAGVQTFHCRGGARLAPRGTLAIINPDEPHDGRSSTQDGYAYRMIYVRPDIVEQALASLRPRRSRGTLPFFHAPVAEDSEAAAAFLGFHAAAEGGDLGALEAESRFIGLLATIFRRHADLLDPPVPARHSPLVRSVRAFLAREMAADPSLTDLSNLTGVSRYHLLRLFKRETGLPPHAYLNQMRLREARRLLSRGETMASVAAAVGFVDQSHLTKRFRGAYGLTPGQYAAAYRS